MGNMAVELLQNIYAHLLSWRSGPDATIDVDLELGGDCPRNRSSKKIEAYKAGYPRFAALIGANPDFLIFRRFLRVRARVLLLKQDKISMLEQQLDALDQNERSLLYLGKSRSDKNLDRGAVLSEIRAQLLEYDSLLESTGKIARLDQASWRDVRSLQNWVIGTSCLSREETKYLQHPHELLTLACPDDKAMKRLEDWTEDTVIRWYGGFRKLKQHDVSDDTSIYLYSGSLIKSIAKAIMLGLIALLLLLPVLICVTTSNLLGRLIIIVLSLITYLSILSCLTHSKMIDLIVAGATFATILTAFISGWQQFQAP